MEIVYSDEVRNALENNSPVVALESTVISHGLPYPENLKTAYSLEKICHENGAVPATIAVFDGEFCVGLSKFQIEHLAKNGENVRKISTRDLPISAAKKLTCATTVATTMSIADKAGIKVFTTGGIGGIHRGFSADVSADLPALANIPIAVVCAGVKIVLDLPKTREWLETFGVTVLGFQCNEMPAFYSRKSGVPVDERVETVAEVAEVVSSRDYLGLKNAILLTVPIPQDSEIESTELETMLGESLELAEQKKIHGKEITPFLLSRMAELSYGNTLKANIALLENNVLIGAQLAQTMISV